tara:strand:+ start:1492 stop:2592 length:1101 start_codon:yes stop_codon:yes gene_type:complete
MRDIWEEQLNWIKNKEPFVLARVIKTWRSAPRKTGAGMLIGKGSGKNSLPKVIGSVSGGCIESAVIEEAMEVLKKGESRQLSYGVEDELALSVGLSCGGEVTVFLERHWAFSKNKSTQKVWKTLQNCIKNNKPAILFTFISPTNISSLKKLSPILVLPDENSDNPFKIVGHLKFHKQEFSNLAKSIFHERENKIINFRNEEVFVQIFPRQDQLLIIGAGHISIPLVKFAREINFITVVIDPRKVFTSAERFLIKPDHLISKWPDDILTKWPINKDTYAILLTHDPKIDDPALHILLKKDLKYIGALGSNRTHIKRCDRLKKAGFDEESIKKIKGPAGFDIGAQTASEIALSMITEVVAAKHGKKNY